MERGGFVYIMTNAHHTTLYTGVTSGLRNRVYEHKNKVYPRSFTARYNLTKLVYYMATPTIEEAIALEKQIKKRSRAYKVKLIESMNPEWKDLYDGLAE